MRSTLVRSKRTTEGTCIILLPFRLGLKLRSQGRPHDAAVDGRKASTTRQVVIPPTLPRSPLVMNSNTVSDRTHCSGHHLCSTRLLNHSTWEKMNQEEGERVRSSGKGDGTLLGGWNLTRRGTINLGTLTLIRTSICRGRSKAKRAERLGLALCKAVASYRLIISSHSRATSHLTSRARARA